MLKNCIRNFFSLFKSLYKVLYLIFALSLFSTGTAFAQATQLNLKKQYPFIQAGSDTWIGTPNGLYQYKSNDDAFKLYPIPGKSDVEIKQLYYNNEWLWCILDSGIAVLQIKLNQWMVFDSLHSLPSNHVNNIAFQGDYVWASTSNGAARFDLLIEEWELYGADKGLPQENILKIFVENDLVWFVTPSGYSEYNPQFEKWRHFQVSNDPGIMISESFVMGNNFWFVTNRGLVKFNPVLNSQQNFFSDILSSENLVNIVFEDNIIWVASKKNIFYIENESLVLKEFEGNNFLEGYEIKNFNLDANEILLATNKNILSWDKTTKTWKIIDYASGISDSVYNNVSVSGGMSFIINNQLIDYKINKDSPWKRFTLIYQGTQNGSQKSNYLKNIFDNEKGGYIGLGKNKIKLDGSRASYIYNKDFNDKVTEGERLDVKGQLALGEYHNIYGFYNNIDYSETMYGVRYKSTAPKEVVREVNLGDYRRDPGTIPFAENASVFGANVWAQAGAKTDRFKRSKYSVKASSGQLRSRKEFEYYQGASNKFKFTIRDVDYAKNTFFSLNKLMIGQVPDKIEVYLDDSNFTNNTKNTLLKTTIAGITGDFDMLIPTEDFYFHERFGVLRMNKTTSKNQLLVVRYTVNNQTFEEVVQANGISNSKANIYSLNGVSIIPNSLRVNIFDTLKNKVNLGNYGIGSFDGMVEPEWLDYENGYLTFPNPYPFPAATYDSLHKSSYRIEAQFETKRSLIKLKHKDLVRGTETVLLDGIQAVQGSDYVLDYTNGTLVFVKEGVVNIDTRIEVEYEYYLDTDNELINSAMANFSPSDNFYIQADWVNFNRTDSSKNDTTTNLVSLYSEIRNRIGNNADVKLITGIAYQPEANKLTGAYVEGLVSTSKLRFQTKYTQYDSAYSNLYEPQSIIGKTKNNLQLYSSADITSFLKLTGDWKNENAFSDSSGKNPNNMQGNYALLLHKDNLPSWQISYQNIDTETDSAKIFKSSIGNQVEYQFPEKIVKYALIKSLKVEASNKIGNQSGLEMLGTDKQKFVHNYIRLNTNFTDQIVGSFYYRRNDYFDENLPSQDSFLMRNERVLIRLAQEQWRLLQMNLSIENTLEQNHLNNRNLFAAKLNKYSQINFRLSPGQLWKKLNPLFFEFNINQSSTNWGTTNNESGSYLWNFYNDGKPILDYAQYSINYYIKNEFRPNTVVLLYSIYEWNNQQNQQSGSSLSPKFYRWSEKLELKINYNIRLILQYKQFEQNNMFGRILKYYEPSSWLEHRWTSSFQDMVNLQYRITNDRENKVESSTNGWLLSYNAIWRKEKFLKMKRIEIRNDISEIITQTSGDKNENVFLFINSTSLDLYPVYSAILRVQYQYKQNDDRVIAKNAYAQNSFNLKFILRF